MHFIDRPKPLNPEETRRVNEFAERKSDFAQRLNSISGLSWIAFCTLEHTINSIVERTEAHIRDLCGRVITSDESSLEFYALVDDLRCAIHDHVDQLHQHHPPSVEQTRECWIAAPTSD